MFLGKSPRIANDETDLPLPDSPTIPRISFLYSLYEILFMTSFLPNEMHKFLTSKLHPIV